MTALSEEQAATYADRFATLADPTRVRLLHAVATSRNGHTVGALAGALGIGQSTCSHHLRRLAAAGLVDIRPAGAASVVTIARRVDLPQPADAVLGLLPRRPAAVPGDVRIRAMTADDWPAVRRIYAEGIATGTATFETTVPSRPSLDAKWLPDHRWVAELGGRVAGWTASAPVSPRECYAGVVETSLYVDARHRGRGVGRALLHRQVTAADAGGLWMLQAAVFAVNRSSVALHHAAGYRTVGIRERIAQRAGTWHDTVLIERRSPAPA